jgi:hypothetical protein
LCVGLVACGGGGGGGGNEKLSVHANQSSVAFELIEGDSQAVAASIVVTLDSAPGTVFPRVRISGAVQPFLSTSVTVLTDTVAEITVSPSAAAVLAGSYTGQVLLDVCADAGCANVLATFPYEVSVLVHRRLALDVPSLAATTPEGVLTTLSASLSVPSLPGRIAVISFPSFLQSGALAEGPVVFTFATAGMAAGSYGGELVLKFIADNGLSSQLRIPVSVNVTAGLVVPADLRWTLNVGTSISSLSASVEVRRADGLTRGWSAVSDADWLLVAPSNSTLPALLNLSVDTAKISALANDTAHTATVTLSSTGSSDARFHVVLDKRLPVVGLVTPTFPGRSAAQAYTLAGRGFSQLTQPMQQLRFGGGSITPSSVQVLSDQLVTAQLPALAPGSYAVDIVSTSGLTGRTAAPLRVPDPTATLPTGFFAFGGLKHLVLHDPVRNAIYAFNRFGDQFLRYTVQAGTLTQTAGGFGQPLNAAVAPDGVLYVETLGANFASGDLLLIDPDTWQLGQRVSGASSNVQKRTGGLSMTADGRLWLLGSTYWDMTDRSTHLTAPLDFSFETAASLNGKVMVGSRQFDQASERYNFLDGTATPFNTVPSFLDAQIDRDGAHLLLDSTVYASNSVALGRLVPAAANEGLARPRLSPDGTRIYAMVAGPFADEQILRVDVFDTTQTVAGTDHLVRLRSLTLPVGAVSSCNLPTSPSGCQSYGDATVSADGRYYIVAADLGILVVDVSEPTVLPTSSKAQPLNGARRWLAPSARQ